MIPLAGCWLGEKRRAKEEASTSSCRPSGYRCGRSQSRGQGELSVDGLSVLIKVMPGQERKKLSHNTVRLHTKKGLDRGFGEGICPRGELWSRPGALPKRERRTLGEKVTLLLGRASLRTGVDHQPYGSFASCQSCLPELEPTVRPIEIIRSTAPSFNWSATSATASHNLAQRQALEYRSRHRMIMPAHRLCWLASSFTRVARLRTKRQLGSLARRRHGNLATCLGIYNRILTSRTPLLSEFDLDHGRHEDRQLCWRPSDHMLPSLW